MNELQPTNNVLMYLYSADCLGNNVYTCASVDNQST